MFGFWDWVGGRYSLSSSIGMSIALTIGFDRFAELLDACTVWTSTSAHPAAGQYLPAKLALIGIWYTNFFDAETEAILPYDQYMHRFPPTSSRGTWRATARV